MIKVVNVKNAKAQGVERIYIGRGSPLGNPFHVKMGRKECIEAYERAIRKCLKRKEDVVEGLTPLVYKDVRDALRNIYKLHTSGKTVELACYCKPLACHGDVIKVIVEEAVQSRKG